MSRPVYTLDFRSRPVGGPVVGRPALYDRHDRLVSGGPSLLAGAEPLTFLVHGFNVPRPEGQRSLTAFADMLGLPGDRGAIVGVLWPGDDRLSPLTYSLEERDADATADGLARVISEVIRPRGPVHFGAHSLGCRVVLETMLRLAKEGVEVGQVALMAAAVDGDALARSTRYRAVVEGAARVAVLHSDRDLVLKLAFPAGDWFAALLFGGYTSRALGAAGPARAGQERVPGTVVEDAVGAFRVGHGDYLPASPPTANQHSAANWAGGVLAGNRPPPYP